MLVALPAIIHALAALNANAVPIRVNYDAPASCPNQEAFYEGVRARTERVRKAQGNEPRVDVNVRVTRGEHGFHGEMREVVNQSETAARSVDGATCKEVVEALSFTVALSFDPEAHAAHDLDETPLPPKPAAPVPITPPVPPSAPAPPAKELPAPLELELGLSVLGTVVESAGFASGGALSAMLLRRADSGARSSGVQISLLYAGTGLLTAPDDHSTRFGALALDACPFRYHTGKWELSPCALGMIGFLELSGRNLAEPETVNRAWWSLGLDLQASLLLGRGLVFESALALTVPLLRHRYYTNSPDNVLTRTAVVSPLLRLGLGYRF